MKYPRNFAVVLWIILATFEGCLSACGSDGSDSASAPPPPQLTAQETAAFERAKERCNAPEADPPYTERREGGACWPGDDEQCCVDWPGPGGKAGSYYDPSIHTIVWRDSHGDCDDQADIECEMENAVAYTRDGIDRCYTPC